VDHPAKKLCLHIWTIQSRGKEIRCLVYTGPPKEKTPDATMHEAIFRGNDQII
jgi:hypothetical protein